LFEAEHDPSRPPTFKRRLRPSLVQARLNGMTIAEGLEPGYLYQLRSRHRSPITPATRELRQAKIDPDELAICVVRGDDARAYPTSALRRSHLVNDRIAGRPTLVTFCGQCSTALAFEPTDGTNPLTFEVFGAYQGSMVMRDEQTGTLWAQFTGEALAGPLTGTALARVPVRVMKVGRWLSLHPTSMTPDLDGYRAARRSFLA
jgi:hypothetical protein